MKDVKEITIPQGSVKKIEDSNGNVIWGSESAFPYRRLEYIRFNGAEYLTTVKPETSKTYKVHFKIDPNDTQTGTQTSNHIMSCAGDNNSNGRCRMLMWYNKTENKLYYRYGRNSSSNNVVTTSIDYSHILRGFHRIYTNSYTHWMSYFDDVTGVETNGTYYNTNNATYQVTLANMPKICLMGYAYDNDSSHYNTDYCTGNVYNFERRAGGGDGTKEIDAYPCQRKSDGKCGLYDVVNGVFYPMSGTNTTTSAAGPIEDEYWDLTTPS